MVKDSMTLCLHTRDAVERNDSQMTFELPPLRFTADTVALASCEFPMVQMTIEPDWSRLYYNEGIRILPDAREVKVATQFSSKGNSLGRDEMTSVTLPIRLNAIRNYSRDATGRIRIQCEEEHGLWCDGGTRLFTPAFEDGVQLLGDSTAHRLDVTDDVRYESPTDFSVPPNAHVSNPKFVFVRAVASPSRLCEWLSHAARGCMEKTMGVRMAFDYDAASDRVVLTGWVDVPGTVIRLMPTALAVRLGLSTAPQRVASNNSHVWPCETSQFWDYVEMPVGFYGPCHRSMCTGAPLRFGPELEASLNRFYFPLKEPQSGASSAHVLVFSDPDGRVYTCSIPCGRYTPSQLCSHIEDEMTRVVQKYSSGVSFAVEHNDDDRFVFSCERRGTDGVCQPVTFGLLFHHPLGVDPERFGFSAQPLTGSDTYISPRRTRVPQSTSDGSGRTVSNLIRVTEMTAQKRFRVHCTAPPAMSGVILSVEDERLPDHNATVCFLQTFVNGRTFAHGFQVGDVVRTSRCAVEKLQFHDGSEVDRMDKDVDADLVVVWAARSDILGVEWKRGRCHARNAVQITCDAEPWNLCFTRKPKSLPPHIMGFGERVVQWGVDGSVTDRAGRRLPPYEAPHSHCLEHPDYVLITFSESSGASFDHVFDGESRQVWCKLSLYPNFREERMLPRNSSLSRAGRFTIGFWNPDFRTPYKFNGADFSFSLSFYD